jgi:hypothetical protein
MSFTFLGLSPLLVTSLLVAFVAGLTAVFVFRRIVLAQVRSLVPAAVALAFFCATFATVRISALAVYTYEHIKLSLSLPYTFSLPDIQSYAALPLCIASFLVDWKVLEYALKLRVCTQA